MVPDDFSRLVIDGAKKGPACDAIIGARPSVGTVLGLEEIDAIAVLRAHDQQPGFWIEAGRAEVGGAAFIRSYQDSVSYRELRRIRNGMSLRIDSLGPVDE